jgi:glutathione peroxidase
MLNTIRHAVVTGALMIAGAACAVDAPQSPELSAKWSGRTVLDLKVKDIDGKEVALADWKGKGLVIVNVASRCGYTPQYEGLQKLADSMKDKGVIVLGFPCNDFGGQEPGTEAQVKEFCSSKYGVKFPMFSKVQTKAGAGQSELYECLGTQTGKLPGWNFSKYVIGKDGKPVGFFGSSVKPDSKELLDAIETALKG